MKVIRRIVSVYNKVEEVFLVVLIAVSVVLLFINVILRYVFNSGIYGADEVARIFFIWMSWLGISIGQRDKEHIRIDILPNALHGTARKVCLVLADLVTLAILGTLLVLGCKVTTQFFNNGLSTPMWKFPKYLLFVSVPFSALMMGLRIAAEIVDIITGKEEAPPAGEVLEE